jgi:hypothetical protein
MKGKISTKLKAVLSDPKGREQLNARLLKGEDGRVVAGNKSYTLRLDVRSDHLIVDKKH